MPKSLRIEWGVYLGLVAASLLLLIGLSHRIIYDQGFIKYSFTAASYPNFDSGIISNLIVGFYNRLFHPPETTVDMQIRILAMLAYSFSALLLACKVLKTSLARILFVLLLFSSRYCFLWLSSELFVGTFLFLSLYAAVRALDGDRSFDVWAAMALVALALTKPDVWLISLVLFSSICWQIQEARRRRTLICAYGTLLLALVGPSLWVHGWHFFDNRSYSSFGQYYSSTISSHQLMSPIPYPWTNWTLYMARIFPGCSNLAEVIWNFPSKYCDAVFLSLARSFRNAVYVFGPLSALIPLLYLGRTRGQPREPGSSLPPRPFVHLVGLTLVGLLPIIFIAWLQVRTLARYYPLAVLCALLLLERKGSSRGRKTMILTVILATFIWNVAALTKDFSNGVPAQIYWFPDAQQH